MILYNSTRSSLSVSSAEAIVRGLAEDGGLFVPASLPKFTLPQICAFADAPYRVCAAQVMGAFLTDYTSQELEEFTARAYSAQRFGAEDAAPLIDLDRTSSVLELFHGPTCAFKDFALQMLPHLLTSAMRKTGVDDTVAILVATSGDTGKAALEGFADVDGTRICVFYPDGGTSRMQRLQMTTQAGKNVMVLAAKGNFDDAQSGVKRIFSDAGLAHTLADAGVRLSSANSINWGRLVPQIAYYFYAYSKLAARGRVKAGDPINIVVPTGNFGNILAAYFAKCCGLPVNKLICASNRNNVLTDFFETGTYDRNRDFHLTTSPSMDILISSNLERLLYLLSDRDCVLTADLMRQLAENGRYTVPQALFEKLSAEFCAGCCDDEKTAQTVREVFETDGYLCDPHTAVAVRVYRDYRERFGDETPTVIASTASPFKFAPAVLGALGEEAAGDDFELLQKLSELSRLDAPQALAGLQGRSERFTRVIEPQEMKQAVCEWLTQPQA